MLAETKLMPGVLQNFPFCRDSGGLAEFDAAAG
jgi:hypothetical protein